MMNNLLMSLPNPRMGLQRPSRENSDMQHIERTAAMLTANQRLHVRF
jgi:hypothetical protein